MFSFFHFIPLLLSLFLLPYVFLSVIVCFPNDYDNEALSSASTTDAQNILSLNLSLCVSHCLISTFSVSLIVVILFSYQTSHSSANWNLITSHKHLLQSVCSDFHKFLEVHLTVSFVHCKKELLVFTLKKNLHFCSTGFYYYLKKVLSVKPL